MPVPTGSPAAAMTIGIVVVAFLSAKTRRRTRDHNNFDIQTNEIVREFGQAFVVTSGPAVFKQKVLAFLVAKFPHRFLEGVHPRRGGFSARRKPILRWCSGCCARAASGHAAALPKSVRKPRRLN